MPWRTWRTGSGCGKLICFQSEIPASSLPTGSAKLREIKNNPCPFYYLFSTFSTAINSPPLTHRKQRGTAASSSSFSAPSFYEIYSRSTSEFGLNAIQRSADVSSVRSIGEPFVMGAASIERGARTRRPRSAGSKPHHERCIN